MTSLSALTPTLRALQDNPTPETAQPVAGWPGRFEIQLEGYLIQYEVVAARNFIKVVLVERA
jgi:hypothetical protein